MGAARRHAIASCRAARRLRGGRQTGLERVMTAWTDVCRFTASRVRRGVAIVLLIAAVQALAAPHSAPAASVRAAIPQASDM